MSLMVKVMAFVLFVNVAITVINGISNPYVGGHPELSTPAWASSFPADSHQYDMQEMKKNVTGFPVDNSGSSYFLIRIFDYITLGFLNRYLSWLNGILYGFPTLLSNAGFLGTGYMNTVLLQMFDSFLTFIYIIGAIQLFTGRDLESGG